MVRRISGVESACICLVISGLACAHKPVEHCSGEVVIGMVGYEGCLVEDREWVFGISLRTQASRTLLGGGGNRDGWL